jgi:NADH:ubiquinone reductase (H+-translocating)
VHAYLMSGVRTRIEAFVDWTWNWFSGYRGPQTFYRSDVARINWSEDATPQAIPSAPEQGEQHPAGPLSAG